MLGDDGRERFEVAALRLVARGRGPAPHGVSRHAHGRRSARLRRAPEDASATGAPCRRSTPPPTRPPLSPDAPALVGTATTRTADATVTGRPASRPVTGSSTASTSTTSPGW